MDAVRDAANKGKSSLNTKQLDYWFEEAEKIYIRADTNTSPESIIGQLDKKMSTYISNSDKPNAICNSALLVDKYATQVANYKTGYIQAQKDLEMEEKRVAMGRVTRADSQEQELKKKLVLARKAQPSSDTNTRWELKKNFANAYEKYITAWRAKNQQDIDNKTDTELAEELDARDRVGISVVDVEEEDVDKEAEGNDDLDNSNNNHNNNSNTNKRKSKKRQIEPKLNAFQSKLREKAEQKMKNEEEIKRLTKDYLEAQTKKIQSESNLSQKREEYLDKKLAYVNLLIANENKKAKHR